MEIGAMIVCSFSSW